MEAAPDDPWRRPGAAARRRRLQDSSRARTLRWTNRIRSIAFIIALAVAAGAGTFLLAADVIDSNEPEYWGTFTHQYYEPRGKSGRGSVGTWVSDDGTTRLDGVALIGHTERWGTVTARYKPTGLMGDARDYTVHTEEAIAQAPFFGWFLTVLGYGGLFGNVWAWRMSRRR